MVDLAFVSAWLDRYASAWEYRDIAAVKSLFDDAASYRSFIFGEAHRGREGVGAYWRGATATQSGVTVRFGDPIVDGDRVAVEWWTLMDDAEEDGPITLPGVLLLRFRDGLCSELREYWHLKEGRVEPYSGWGEFPVGSTGATRDSAALWARDYERAWNAGDPRAAAALYSSDVTSRTHPFREPSRGRAGVLAYTQKAYASERATHSRFGVPFVGDGGAAVEWWATYVEDGSPKTLAGCSVLAFDTAGLVTSARDYWHETTPHLTPPPEWGT
ncbi:MAG TPA: nuclear transport factor 2 family protein [Actinomycetota bacterium]|jgi:ketosteroid isomerase-like protein|nr:nuclear transport factor 2 family protein [Actinomycetota bacterium]